jgi:hypothetical protein
MKFKNIYINLKRKKTIEKNIIKIVVCEVVHSKSISSFSLCYLIVLRYIVSCSEILFE